MGSMICGKCESESTYYQDGGLACMKCGNRSPSRWGFHRKGEEIKPPEPIEEYQGPEDEKIEQEEIEDMGKKRTPEQRERIAAGIRAALAKKKAAAGGQSKVEKKPKPAAAPPLPPEEVARNRARAGLVPEIEKGIHAKMMTKDEVVAQDKAAFAAYVAHAKDERLLVILDFNLAENKHLLEPWTEYCRKSHRRNPADQAMMAIEQILTNEGLI